MNKQYCIKFGQAIHELDGLNPTLKLTSFGREGCVTIGLGQRAVWDDINAAYRDSWMQRIPSHCLWVRVEECDE